MIYSIQIAISSHVVFILIHAYGQSFTRQKLHLIVFSHVHSNASTS